MSRNEVPIERAVGTARLARDFCEAASHYEPPADRISLVTYFLAGHALELAFKAALIIEGTTEKRLKDLGHDLEACYRAAAGVVPDGLLDDPRVGEVVGMIASHYEGKAFEYVIPGPARLPFPTLMTATIQTVVEELQGWIEASVRLHLRRDLEQGSAE